MTFFILLGREQSCLLRNNDRREKETVIKSDVDRRLFQIHFDTFFKFV